MENTKPLRLKDIRRLITRGAHLFIEVHDKAHSDLVSWKIEKSSYGYLTIIYIDIRFFAFFGIDITSLTPNQEEAAKLIDKLTAKLGPDFFYRRPTEIEKAFQEFLQQLAQATREQEKQNEQQKQSNSKQQQTKDQQNTQSNSTTQSNQRGDSNGLGEKSDTAKGETGQAEADSKDQSNTRHGRSSSSSSDELSSQAPKDDTAKSNRVGSRNKSELAGQKDQVATETNRIERPAEEEKSQTGSGSATTNRQRLAETKALKELIKRLKKDVSSDTNAEAPPSSVPRKQFGGVSRAQRAAEQIAHHKDSQKAARKIKKHIEKIIKNTDINGRKQSPRLNAGVLVKQGLSKSYNMSRIRREESNLPVTILMCDISPSCRSVSTGTLAACYSISEELDNAYLIVHSNAFFKEESEIAVSEFLKKKFADRDIGLILSFADHDGEDDFANLPKMCETFIWLDSGRYGISEEKHSLYGDFDAPNLRYWRGINDIRTAEIALRFIAKNPKKGV